MLAEYLCVCVCFFYLFEQLFFACLSKLSTHTEISIKFCLILTHASNHTIKLNTLYNQIRMSVLCRSGIYILQIFRTKQQKNENKTHIWNDTREKQIERDFTHIEFLFRSKNPMILISHFSALIVPLLDNHKHLAPIESNQSTIYTFFILKCHHLIMIALKKENLPIDRYIGV